MLLFTSALLGDGSGFVTVVWARVRQAYQFTLEPTFMFTDLVIVKVPLQRQPCAPVSSPCSSLHNNLRMLRWDETAEAHTFKLRLPGMKKEELNIQIEDRTLYLSHNSEPKMGTKEGESSSDSQCTEKKPASCTFMRTFKLPENADLEQIKANVTNETLTITIPKLTMKSPEVRKINVRDGDGVATSLTAASEKSKAKATDASEPTSK
uniref:SHSP domain-containing protein n=2 Tax=Physcomitrium patens TaxID=3218 RepID=A0A7I4F7L3_PHYPA